MVPLHAKWYLFGSVIIMVHLASMNVPAMCRGTYNMYQSFISNHDIFSEANFDPFINPDSGSPTFTTTAKPKKASTPPSNSNPTPASDSTPIPDYDAQHELGGDKGEGRSSDLTPKGEDELMAEQIMNGIPDYDGDIALDNRDLNNRPEIEHINDLPYGGARLPTPELQQVAKSEEPQYPMILNGRIRLEYVPELETKNTFKNIEALRLFRSDWAKGEVKAD